MSGRTKNGTAGSASPPLPFGRTPVHAAAETGDAEALEALLADGADPRAEDDSPDRWTPLMLAAAKGHAACVGILARYGAGAGGGAEAALWDAVRASSPGCAEILLRLLPDSPTAPPLLDWLLLDAARAGGAAVASILTREGADPGFAEDFGPEAGMTALHLAARAGSAETCMALLAMGADPDARDAKGNRPVDSARGRAKALLEAMDLDGEAGGGAGGTPRRI